MWWESPYRSIMNKNQGWRSDSWEVSWPGGAGCGATNGCIMKASEKQNMS